MSLLNDFKKFAVRGNVIDLAVAVIIGAAFGKIIASLVDGIIMPLIGLLLGGVNVTDKTYKFGSAVVKWGLFLQSIIDFTLIALSIFLIIRLISSLQKKEEQKPTHTYEEKLLEEIRDILKAKT